MCLFNSTCDAAGTSCGVCPEGFVNDLSFFHQPNCGMPEYALPIFAGIFSAVWLATGLYALAKLWTVKNKTMLSLGWETMIYHLSIEIIVIGLATQDGMFEVTLFGLMLFNITVFRLIVRMVNQMFIFKNGFKKRHTDQVSRAFGWLKIFHGVFIFAFGIATIVLSRDDAFDRILFSYEVVQLAMMNVLVVVMMRYTRDFLKQLKNSQNSNEVEKMNLEDVRSRILAMTWKWSLFLGVLPVVASIGFAIRLILNSLPYMFVFYLSGHIWTPLFTIGVVSLFPRSWAVESAVIVGESTDGPVVSMVRSSKEY